MFWRGKRSERDFSSELQAHIDLEADRLRAEGLSGDEAYSRARKIFGNVTLSDERFYESGRVLWFEHLRQDLGYALRQLGRKGVHVHYGRHTRPRDRSEHRHSHAPSR